MDRRKIARKAHLVDTLELICQELEPTPTMFNEVETSYGVVSDWLQQGQRIKVLQPVIFPQGSWALETVVRPWGRNEFDLDFICHFLAGTERHGQAEVLKMIGDRLGEHGTYKNMREPKNRCWRLNYANQFHMDITPAIPNLRCLRGGLLVPDRELVCWKPTNPKGYVSWFREKANLVPRVRTLEEFAGDDRLIKAAAAEPLPQPRFSKGVLRRAVQIMKRHRDIYFSGQDGAPISIILTTLAARAYARVVASNTYDSEFDLLFDVLVSMPDFVERRVENGRIDLWVPNPTTDGENFAEKWNCNPRLPLAFSRWLNAAQADLRRLEEEAGADALQQFLSEKVGEGVTKRAFAKQVEAVSTARERGTLRMERTSGITALGGLTVPRNTFFGEAA